MKNKKRKCIAKTKKSIFLCGFWQNIDLEFEGMFHCWGNEAVEAGESGFGNFTIGIVEDQTDKFTQSIRITSNLLIKKLKK